MRQSLPYYCCIALVLLFIGCGGISVLAADDTLATLKISKILQVASNIVEFDLNVQRDSEEWKKWANGTFQIVFPGISTENCKIELLPNTTSLDESLYLIKDSALAHRISFTILGPDEYWQCVDIKKDSSARLGRFRVTAPPNVILPSKIEWVTPYEKYQANAYKIDQDNDPWHFAHDNIEMTNKLRFVADTVYRPDFILEYLTAKYVGDRKVLVCWKTKSEAFNQGFILKRGIKPFGEADYSNTDFSDSVTYNEKESLRGLGTSIEGKEYCYVDTVPYRGEEYAYKLFFRNFAGADSLLGIAPVSVPSSVIAFAQANPNPFKNNTTIEYILDDRVVLSAKVYDPTGKLLDILIDNKELPMGNYNLRFIAPDVSSQGLYDVVFTAYPVDDPNVEVSTAVVKLQLIR